MKNEKHQQARDLYFQTRLTKTEIAAQLGVNRRTIMLWCSEGNWQQLKKSAENMPALVAEKCYYLLDQYASSHLVDGAIISNFSWHHADVINKLASSIKKIKNRSTVNESMELFNFFIQYLRKKDPDLADIVLPHMEDYIWDRRNVTTNDALLEGFNPDASLPFPDKEIQEQWQDEKDNDAFKAELKNAGNDFDEALERWQGNGQPTAPAVSQAA